MPSETIDSPRAELSSAKRVILEARLRGLSQQAGIVPRAARGEAPLSFAQERFWFLERAGQGGAAYIIRAPLRLGGALRVDALERALGEVVRRHEALRTTFREDDGVPVQVVAPFGGFTLPVDDLSALPEAEREAEVRRRWTLDGTTVFDLVNGPVFRARLLRLASDEHVLLLAMHHIASDGWSMGVLTRELWTLYNACRDGAEPRLAALPVQYADYAVWQREQAAGAAEARRLAYWKAQLAGAPPLLELPADHPRPPTRSLRGGTVPVNVPARVAERLRELGRGEGATLYMVVLAAFQVLLSRYSGSDDVVVGTLVAGRTRVEVQDLVGLFMNTLVLRTRLAGDPSFRELVGRVRETVLGAYEHQDLTFEKLVAELQPERSLSHSALFQVLFQLESAEPSGADAPPAGLRVRGVEGVRETAKFDLTLDLAAHPGGIGGVMEYSTDLFERGTVQRMVEHLERLLEQAADAPGLPVSRLKLMGRTERARVVGWNRTTARYPADRCIHHLFEAQAERTPDAVAVTFAGESLTYRALDERANRLAHHLARLGVGPEVRVGLCMERSLELMAAILGVMKAGGAYVPLDPAHPAERLGYMLDDSGVAVLLTQARLGERLPARPGLRVVAVDQAWGEIAREPAHAPGSAVTSENLAYVIYTSGSTGRPKGVAMHHRGVCNYIHWGTRAYGAAQGSGSPVFTSMAVDLTITNLLPLFTGHAVHLLAEENPVEALAEVLRGRPGFGVMKITPTHLSLLTPLLTPDEAAGAARTLVIGADFLNAEPTLFWQEHAPRVRLMNEYGPTETVVGCSAYVLPPGKHRAGPVPVGHPIQNLTFYVLDAHLEPVPVGLPGELFIGGAGVARGYLGRPGLSAEKFVPDPFAEAGTRMYRTGDRARWLADGNLLILGRSDNQVKLRGYRVELGEVEAVLRLHPSVTDAVAVVREDRPGDRRLVAYVVGEADAATLREHALQSLPEYMVPGAFVRLGSLPLTSTGKFDRRALPAPEYGSGDAGVEAPGNFVEVQLIHIWEELLGVAGIGPTQDFFELGGNSLLALRLFAAIQRRLACDLPLAILFAGPTVRKMAAAVLEQRQAAPAPPAPVVPLQPNGTLPPLFCVHPAGREVHGYIHLVRHLGGDQPVYGVRDLGDLGRPVAQIAAEHVRAIRAVQPEGPYHLLGWSFGGIVAYEMAAELERQGQRVAFMGVLDTIAGGVGDEMWAAIQDATLIAGLAGDVAAQMGRPFALGGPELDGLPLDEQFRRAAEALHAQQAAPAGYEPAALRAAYDMVHARTASRAGYAATPFSGTVSVFSASAVGDSVDHDFVQQFRSDWSDEDVRTLCWCRLMGDRVEVHPVPGTHVTIGVEPNVRTLAERVREALAAARERARTAAEPRVHVPQIFPQAAASPSAPTPAAE